MFHKTSSNIEAVNFLAQVKLIKYGTWGYYCSTLYFLVPTRAKGGGFFGLGRYSAVVGIISSYILDYLTTFDY